MLNTKIFTLESSDGSDINIGIIEKLRDEHTLLFTWESSQMMSAYILNNKQLFANSSVLEIGAGNDFYCSSFNKYDPTDVHS